MAAHVADLHDEEAHEHPGERTYIKIAVILAIITVVEVAIYYIEGVRDFLVPALLIMSVTKFVFVVSYFMHLKFDDRRLAWTFGLAVILALSIVLALDILQHFHGFEYARDFLTGH